MEIKLTIDRIENNQAILKTPDNETLVWPITQLPANIREGSTLYCRLSKTEEKANNAIAKDILNEILDTKD